MSDCTLCQFGDRCKTNKMEGRGAEGSPIMIVLDAPDWIDDKEGTPASGDGGNKLWYLMAQAGLKRSEVFITHAVKCKPTVKPAEVKPKEVNTCRIHLLSEIKKHKPKVIITMGKLGHQSLTGEASVGDFRGHFNDFEMDYTVRIGEDSKKKNLKAKIMPTFSPFAALSKWEYDDYIIHDLKKAKAYSQTLVVPMTPTPKWTTVMNMAQLNDFHKTYTEADMYVHDFETTSLDFNVGEVINSGYCASLDVAHIVYFLRKWPMEHQKKFTNIQKNQVQEILEFTNTKHKQIMEAVKDVHASNAKKAGHNHKFDKKFAKKAGVPFKNARWDTVVMGAIVDENKYHDLNSEMEYRGINYGPYDTKLWPYVNKDRAKKKAYTHVPPDMLDHYLAIDVCGDFRLLRKMRKEVKDEGFMPFYLNQQRPLIEELYRMEYHGFKINTPQMKEDAKKLQLQIDEKLAALKKFAKDENFNPNSPEQLSRLLEARGYPFEKLEIKKGKKGYSTGVDALKKFSKYKKWKEIPEIVLGLRGISKLKNTYIENGKGDKGMFPKVDKNGFLHCSFNAHTPRTGRLSSDSPNFQNIPNPSYGINIRNYFIPPYKDWCTWEADFMALEMHVVAHLAQDKVMLKQLQDGYDMHSFNAVRFGHVLGFVPKDIDYDAFREILKFEPPKGWDKMTEAEKIKTTKNWAKIDAQVKRAKAFKKLRNFAKAVGFGLNYGIEARTLAEDHDVPLEDVEVAIDLYFDGYKGLARWRQEQIEIATTTGVSILPWTGRKRRVTQFTRWIKSKYSQEIRKREFDISEVGRQLMNFPVQGFANEIYTQAKLRVIKRLRKEGLKSKILISIHDGVVGIGPKSEMIRVKQICHEEMTTILGEGKNKLTLNVEFNANEYWYGPELDLEKLAS